MSSGDDDDLDCILGGPVSGELVAMTGSPQLTTRLLAEHSGVVPVPTNDAGSTPELPPREGRTRELQKGGPCQAVLRSQT